MSSRPRSLRASRLPLKRLLRPRLEDLETRLVLSTLDFSATPQYQVLYPGGVSAARGGPGDALGASPFASSLTPAQIQSFYGVNQIFFGNIQGNGAGQTIAIVDAFDNPSLINSFNGKVTSGDLFEFDKQFGLNNNINFTKVNETGSTSNLPAADPGWAGEEALDVEWAHAMAPNADIVLVEASSQNFAFDMTTAIKTAASLPGVSVVSMSFGYPELPNEVANFNSVFTTPAGHQGVSFISATSDTGSMGAGTVVDPYSGRPAFLPNVISVGGTSLNVQSGSPTMETAWNQGGGGFSKYVPEPAYQQAVQNTGFRSAPDVSADANLFFGGVAVYSQYVFGFTTPWNQVGGTSLATPLWAGLIADANQGRVLAGGTTLDGPSQTLPGLYSLPHYDFNDILAGDNEGYGATVGYDEVTGLGTPRANVLVPDLAAYGLGVQQAPGTGVGVAVQPPSTVDPGQSFGLSATVRDSFGNTDAAFAGTATLTSSITGKVVATASIVNGVAVFDGLTLASGQSATYTVAVTGTTFTVPTNLVTASTGSEPLGSMKLYPAPSYASLAAALQTAASSSATDITIVLEDGIYGLTAATAAPLVINNTSGVAKTITIQGAAMNSTIIDPSRIAGWGSSIFQILGATGAPLTVKIEGLTIKDGVATAGVAGSKTAEGGGLLIDGGTVSLSQVALVRDSAVGAAGLTGSTGKRKRPGGPGGAGQAAAGGGLYVNSGHLSLVGVTFQNDNVWGGRGGAGGVGGTDGGSGGFGGIGGAATGGAAYVAGGTVTGSGDAFLSDAAVGGSGGYGGLGGLGGTAFGLGAGGHGGAAGNANGGGLFVGGGSVTLGSTPFNHDLALGGNGGTGGLGGLSFSPSFSSTFTSFFSIPFSGRGGRPGSPGNASGGAIFIGGGSLTLGATGAATTNIQNDRALGGYHGSQGSARVRFITGASSAAGGNIHGPHVGPVLPISIGGQNPHSRASGTSVPANAAVGLASGGAIYVAGGSVSLFDQNISHNLANYGGAIYEKAGTVTASSVKMSGNAAETGGAVFNARNGVLSIRNGLFTGNKAAHGVDAYTFASGSTVGVKGSDAGAIYNGGRLNLSTVTVSKNSGKSGGAILNHSGTIAAGALDVTGNKAVSRGGGIYSFKGSLTIVGGTIEKNTVSATGTSPSVAIGSGGGLDLVSAKVSISGVTLMQNTARAGGGIYISAGSATLTANTFEDNVGRQDGGALYGNGNITISQGTIQGNFAGIDGGGIDNFGNLSISNVMLSGNSASSDGGAIKNVATMSLYSVTITGNSAGSLGGGLDSGGTVTMQYSNVTSNTATNGGGIFNVGGLTMTNGDAVMQNLALNNGGGIDQGSGGRVKATGLTVSDNTASLGNGGGIFDQRGALTITGGEIANNAAPANQFGDTQGWGGGLYDTGGKISLSATPVEGNSSVRGAGLYITSGSVSLVNELVDGNTAVQFGGGVWNQGILSLTTTILELNVAQQNDGGGIENLAKLTVNNSIVSQNTASAGTGGNLFNGQSAVATIAQSTIAQGAATTGGNVASSGTLTIGTSTISNGTASGTGGGIANLGTGLLLMTNSTVAGNTSVGNGGGVVSLGTFTAVNDTIAYNKVGGLGAGGGLDVGAGTTALYNTIVDVNTTGGGTDVAGTLSPLSSNNLFGSLTVPYSGSNPNLSGITPQQAHLDVLKNNGGPTQTIALLNVGNSYSLAIDGGSTTLAKDPTTGKALNTDQRGALRGTQGVNAGNTVDIGAFEASSSYLVTATSDVETTAGTLRSGIAWAGGSTNDNPANIASPAPNTVVFDTKGTFAAPQTISLASTLVLPSGGVPVEIEGPGGGVVTITGGGQFQVIQVKGGTAILQGITITGGSATTGGGVGNAGKLTLNNTTLVGNSAGTGGGVYSSGNGSSLTINDGTIQGNTAANGAGVYSGTSLTLANVTIQGNTATLDGGGVDLNLLNGGSLSFTGSTISGNTAATGGGLFLLGVNASLSGGSIASNLATIGGGVYSGGNGAALTITGTSFTGNSAVANNAPGSGAGGAIESTGTLSVAAATLANNSAATGAAIDTSGAATITTSNFTSNAATGSGGGLNNAGNLQISSTTLSGNTAGSGGGIASSGTLTVASSTLTGNSAGSGGAVYDSGGQNDVITNVTIAGNSAVQGGGIFSNNSALSLVNTTVAYNTLGTGSVGAGVASSAGTVGLYNTIVDLNSGTAADDVDGSITGSNNLIGSLNSTIVNANNPGLALAPANNGGPTQTIALLADSPALNAGASSFIGVSFTVPIADQRGAVRGSVANVSGPANAGSVPDIGAYEASSEYQVGSAADTNDLGSLRTAVSWANISTNANLASASAAPNTVDFGSGAGPGTITLSPNAGFGTLVLSNSVTPVTMTNSGSGSVTISGGGLVGVVQVTANVTANLGNLTITGGLAATGGGINNSGTLTISGLTIEANTANGSGGGVNNAGTLSVSSTTISGNKAGGSGGGINNTGVLTLAGGTTISANSATASGGGIADPGTLTLASDPIGGSTVAISGNAARTGGGIAVGGTLTDTGSTFTGNNATGVGGGIAVLAGGTVSLSSSSVSGNVSGASGTGAGGGIDNAGTLTLYYATVASNSASGAGGGVANESGGTLTASYSPVMFNNSTGSGGGIDNSGVATISVSTLAGNSALANGGALGNEPGATLTLTSSTLSGNSATSGGGIANTGTANVTNVTIANNQGVNGGGIYQTGKLTSNYVTIAGNAVGAGGTAGGLDAVRGTTTLFNTIVALNTSLGGSASDAIGSLAPTSGFDLFGTGGSGGLSAINSILSNQKNPGLAMTPGNTGVLLASDGGPTQTIALLASSPAIDAGSASVGGAAALTVDQRGAVRGAAGVNAGSRPDIGAFEASSSYLVNTTVDSQDIGTLRAAINWANLSKNFNAANAAPNTPAPNTVVFDTTGSFATAQTITLSPTLGAMQLSNSSTAGEMIDGTASNGLTISGGGQTQLFSISAGATATLTGLMITGGSSVTSGGAITNSGTLTVNSSTLMGNSATTGGGAIDNLGTLSVQSSTLGNNSAGEFGGAIDNETAGHFTAMNSTLSNNAASNAGGGIYSTGTFTSINATLAYNTTTVASSGGGLNAAGGTASLFNTIVALNTNSTGNNLADDIAGSVTGSNNLVGTGGSGGLVNNSNGNLVGVTNPGLGAGLGSNGGPTQTILLLPTSPAIGTGARTVNSLTVGLDQRGALRGTTVVDIGAFELTTAYLVTTAQDSTVPGTLRSAVAWANSNSGVTSSVPLTILFDTNTNHVFAAPQTITLALGTLALTNASRPIILDGPGAANLTISGNSATGVFSIASGVNVAITGVTIANGFAFAGAGINNAGTLSVGSATIAGNPVVNGVSFVNNSSQLGSGAAINNTGALTVTSSSFSGNSGDYYGGAIFNDDGTATITNSNFVNNSTLYGLGGAIDNLGGTLTVTGGTFQGNSAFQGGAIYNRDDANSQLGIVLPAITTLNSVTITGNSAYQGGGLFNEGTMTVSASAIANNSAFQGGAASNNFGGSMVVSNSTLAANTAQQFGGAIDNVNVLTVISSTIAYNVVAVGGSGAGIDAYAGSTSLYDTIAALNTIGTGTAAVADDITGQVAASSSYNLVGKGGLINGVNHNIVGSKNPGLATGLANNGGPTQTIALFTGSPAIGAGSATIAGVAVPTVDQRGVARPATGYNIGAYQGSIPAPVTTTTTATTSTTTATSATTALVTPSSFVASPAIAAAPASAPATAAPVITGTSPFSGRHLKARGHKAAKTAHHAAAIAHQPARVVKSSPKAEHVRLAKHHR